MPDISKNTPPFDVALVSDMCVDLILSGNVRPQFSQVEQIVSDYNLELGGSANIFACQMAKLGGRTAVLGKLGADHFGDFAFKSLTSAGVDCSNVTVDPLLKTGLSMTLAEPSDRAILTFLGSITALAPHELPSSPGALARHWHVASFFLFDRLRHTWSDFLSRAKAEGATVSFDPNWDPENRWEGIQELLPLIDILLPNSAEAVALTGEPDVLRASRLLTKSGPLVVTKLGAQGAIAVQGDKVWSFDPAADGQAEPIIPVDTVGAGDNFDAGFIRAWMTGAEIPKCLRVGHQCAAASLLASGGVRGQLVMPL